MPVLKALLVVQERKSKVVVLIDKDIPSRDIVEAIQMIATQYAPANKVVSLQLASGLWSVKSITDIPAGRSNVALLASKVYPGRKRIALMDQIHDELRFVPDWHNPDEIEETLSKLLQTEEGKQDERRLKKVEAEFQDQVDLNRKTVAGIREEFGALRIGKRAGNFDTEMGENDMSVELAVIPPEPEQAPNPALMQNDPNQVDPNDPNNFDRFQVLNLGSNKLTQCFSKFPDLWRRYIWFKVLVITLILVIIGVPLILVIIYTKQ